MHGGTTPRGTASPHFRHGRYSKALPDRIAARYAEALADPAPLELHDEVALLDARIAELLGRLQGDPLDTIPTPRHGSTMTESGVWAEISWWIARRLRLVESERRWMAASGQMISVTEALALVATLTDVIQRHIHDRATRTVIGREFQAIVERNRNRRGMPPTERIDA